MQRKRKISLVVVIFCITMLAVYYVREKYFALGDFYILPVFIALVSITYLFIHVVKKGTYPSKNLIVIFLVFYIFFSMTFRGYYSFDMVASYFLIFALFYFVTIFRYSYKELKIILFCYVLSALILSLLLFFQLRMPYLGVLRFSVFYSDFDFYDVNFLASYLLLPALFSFYFSWIKPQKGAIKFFYILSNIVIFSAIIATGSRGALIGIFIGLIPLVRHFFTKRSILFFVILFVILIYIYLPEELGSRFFMDSYDDGSNARRLDDWHYGLIAFLKSPFLGCGFFSTSDIIYNLTSVRITAHNSYLVILLNFGLLGGIPFFYWLFKPLLKWKNNFMGIYHITFYLAFLFNIFLIEATTSFVFIIPLIIYYILVNYGSLSARERNSNKFYSSCL